MGKLWKPFLKGAVAVSVAVATLFSGISLAAAADAPIISVKAALATDGSAPFDDNDKAGYDSGANNKIVRVNDTVDYSIQYAVNGAAGNNTTLKAVLPLGMEMTAIPAFCTSEGSALSPQSIGSASLPYSSTSINELQQQTLTCNLGTKENAADTVDITAKVSSLVHNGTKLQPVISITADGADEVTSPDVDAVTATSTLKWDLSKNGTSRQEDAGETYGPRLEDCPDDATHVCYFTDYSVLFSASPDGKGAMPAVGDVTFVDDVSARKLFPGLTEAQYQKLEADPAKYGVKVTVNAVDQTGHNTKTVPMSKIDSSQSAIDGSASSATNSVRDSGTVSVNQAANGSPATITVANADWSLATFPTKASDGSDLPSSQSYAVSANLEIHVPQATVQDFGISSQDMKSLATSNTYTDLKMQGFESTDVETSETQPATNGTNGTWNDHRSSTIVSQKNANFDKAFEGVTGAKGNTGAAEFYPDWNQWAEGMPGGAMRKSGVATVAPGQQVISGLSITGANPSDPSDVSRIACDTFDNTKINLSTVNDMNGDGGKYTGYGMFALASQGKPVWVTGYLNQTGIVWDPALAPTLKVQYTTGATVGSGEASDCSDPNTKWYDSPEDVPGNDAAQMAKGIYTAVNRVRVYLIIPKPTVTMEDYTYVHVAIGMTVADSGEPDGTKIPNYASNITMFGKYSMDEVLASGTKQNATYDVDKQSGSYGDRLIYAHAQARVSKQVRKGSSGDFQDSVAATGGDEVDWKISPTLTSGASTKGVKEDVWVEDCLPAGFQVDSTKTSLAPTLMQATTPDDAKRPACGSGETYIRWVLKDQEVNGNIDPITLVTSLDQGADNGDRVNTAYVWSNGDASPQSVRNDSATVTVQNIAGIKLDKKNLTPQVQVNRAEATSLEENQWELRLSNTLPKDGKRVTDPKVYDILPQSGVRNSSYSGTSKLTSVTVTSGGDDVEVKYTNATNVSRDTSAMPGDVKWCAESELGSSGCPASLADTTAIELTRQGVFAAGDVISAQVHVALQGDSNGDVISNETWAQVTGLDNAVGPIDRPQPVMGGSLGDYVWWDLNRNGIQDADETPASGVKVRLTGTDDLGNAVDLSTTTNKNGKYEFSNLRASKGDYTITVSKPKSASGFTAQKVATASGTTENDSNVDSSGAAQVGLAAAGDDQSIDAGLLADGTLNVVKQLSGEGVQAIKSPKDLGFTVVCKVPGAQKAFTKQFTLTEDATATSLSADPITLPVGSTCTVQEIATGNADAGAKPAPVTVTIPWNGSTRTSDPITASLTNYYSAGTVKVTKKLTGDKEALEAAKSKTFEFLVTCAIDDPAVKDPVVVQSGTVTITGAGTAEFADTSGKAYRIPAGAKCYAEETNDGGAIKTTLKASSFEEGVSIVKAKDADTLSVATIDVTNVFTNPPTKTNVPPNSPNTPDTPDAPDAPGAPGDGEKTHLAVTGTAVAGIAAVAVALVAVAVVLLVVRKKRRSHNVQ
jgi:hypothetical protein